MGLKVKVVEREGRRFTFIVSPDVCESHKIPMLVSPDDLGVEFCTMCHPVELNAYVDMNGEEIAPVAVEPGSDEVVPSEGVAVDVPNLQPEVVEKDEFGFPINKP